MTKAVLFVFSASLCLAEVRTMTLREAIDLAIRESPDVVMARLDEQKARDQVRIAKDPFTPKVYGGSGLAYTTGFPTSIDGNAPSIFEARTSMSIYNRPASYLAAQASENARGAEIQFLSRQDEVAYRTAALFFDAEEASLSLRVAGKQVESLEKVEAVVRQRVQEGRELAIEAKRAALNLLKARQRVENLTMDADNAERSLAMVLGFDPEDRVEPADEQRGPLKLPLSEEETVEHALTNSREIRLLESEMQAKGLEVRSYRAARLPRVGLVAQYSLLGKYNRFEDYFRSFQRNNAELGISIEVPLLVGGAAKAYVSQAEAEVLKLRAKINQTRGRISVDARKSYQDVKRAEMARDVARADLELARDQLSIYLAQSDEGRAPLATVESARVAENEKWIAYYDAQHALERARLNVLRQTGTLVGSLK